MCVTYGWKSENSVIPLKDSCTLRTSGKSRTETAGVTSESENIKKAFIVLCLFIYLFIFCHVGVENTTSRIFAAYKVVMVDVLVNT